ncbi:hypothetical protein [Nocardia inohanensis]|uniref:hypothetical protein n=1 Tax=Nocardia inohanensis TaxID=209246 RepID=UPI00350E59A4
MWRPATHRKPRCAWRFRRPRCRAPPTRICAPWPISSRPAARSPFSVVTGAVNNCDALLMLGTDFPFANFLPQSKVKTIQVDRNAKHLGRRIPLELAVIGDVRTTVQALLPLVRAKSSDRFLKKCVKETEHFVERMQHYVTKGPDLKPIRPEYLASILDEEAADDALFFADTGTAVIWAARHIHYGPNRRLFGSFSWASMANASRVAPSGTGGTRRPRRQIRPRPPGPRPRGNRGRLHPQHGQTNPARRPRRRDRHRHPQLPPALKPTPANEDQGLRQSASPPHPHGVSRAYAEAPRLLAPTGFKGLRQSASPLHPHGVSGACP